MHIEYFYSAHSAFAYIGAARLYAICAAAGRSLIHRPIDLNPVVAAAGGLPYLARSQAHREYFFGREIERWAEYRGVPIIDRRPRYHDRPLALANGLLLAAVDAGIDVDALSLAVLRAHWRDDADLADASTLAGVARAAGADPEPLLDAARSESIQAVHRANTSEAIARNVFGSPTYFVNGEMFYGQDRLEFVERAVR